MVLRKPPNSICLESFLEESSVGCLSSTIYDIVAFLSIMPNTDKVVLATKIKERWRISSMSKLIGSGERLCQMLAYSRIIVLERVRSCDSNFLHAIAQCCTIEITDIGQNRCKMYKTLHDAIRTIESEPAFAPLNDILTSRYTSYYECLKCRTSPDSLTTTQKCVSIYETRKGHSQPHAIPIVRQNTFDMHCSVCSEQTKNKILPIFAQVHHDYPLILIYHSSRTTFRVVTDLLIEFESQNSRCKYVYKPISILLVDRFNAISIIKIQDNLVYCKSPYEVPTSLSNDEINELFDTSASVVVFLKQVREKSIFESIQI